MYSLVSGVYDAYLAPQQLNLLIVGAQGVGKTTLMERLKVTHFQKKHRVVVEPALTTLPVNIFRGETIMATSHTAAAAAAAAAAPNSDPSPLTLARKKKRGIPPRRLLSATPGTIVKHRLAWVCPAPPKYANAAVDDDDDDDDNNNAHFGDKDDKKDLLVPYRDVSPHPNSNTTGSSTETQPEDRTPGPQPLDRRSSTQTSMQSIDLNDETNPSSRTMTTTTTSSSNNHAAYRYTTDVSDLPPLPQRQQKTEYDLRPKAKMLPLERIRPTIGMNLGKIDICGAKCHVWDLGGRLQDLWERYYDDCDAVVFVWKIEDESGNDKELSSDDDSDSDQPAPATYEQQNQLLQQVRNAIADEVPILVLVHYFSSSSMSSTSSTIPTGVLPDQRYATAPYLLPHYHNPLQSLFVINAATGQGVKSAMEWLIPLAKQQQRMRDRTTNEENDDLVKPAT